ncbi:cytochrome P450 [Desertibacillus haloalkaliphilus]|uniref:cytochrome P450 n=1 Tax=Desertibacillus haloalkaliphilus TaxID=1328930 RepID=UPI001C27F40C|nr:cytochrome P450 [Desertibacillus haloalkaliphilus]MBU8905333.1 cytochrome P450 [Desertibacillus haloalkaliphilus]
MIKLDTQNQIEPKTNPFNSAAFVKNPYPFYDQLRSEHPVSKRTLFKYPGWYITGYEETVKVLKDTRFKNRPPIPQTSKRYRDLANVQKDMLVFKNPPDHMRLRKLVSHVFTPQMVNRYHFYIEETVDQLLGSVQNEKRMDVVSDFAFPLTSMVIANIVGVPEEDRHLFREWTVTLLRTIDLNRTRNSLANGNETTAAVHAYFLDLINKRRDHPTDDLISKLIKQEQQGDAFTDDEIVATCLLLVIAGHETTVNLISNSVFTLANHPDQMEKLKEAPAMIETAVEEFLRYESPTQMLARVASEDIEVNQQIIREGEQVYLFLGAANRDPNVFEDPHRLNLARNPNPHVAFGVGNHFCLGSTLARIEAKVAIHALLKRTSTIQLATSVPKWRKLTAFRSLKELPITFP